MTPNPAQRQKAFAVANADQIAALPWEFRRSNVKENNGALEAFVHAENSDPEQKKLLYALAKQGMVQESADHASFAVRYLRDSQTVFQNCIQQAHARDVDDQRNAVTLLPWKIPYLGSPGHEWATPVLIFPLLERDTPQIRAQMLIADAAYQSGMLKKLQSNLISKEAYACDDPALRQVIEEKCRRGKKAEPKIRVRTEGHGR